MRNIGMLRSALEDPSLKKKSKQNIDKDKEPWGL